jgi:heme A synthase
MFNFDWLNDVSLSGARILLILAFLSSLIFALLMKKSYIFKDAKNQRRWRDFRYWILILVIVQILLYSYF